MRLQSAATSCRAIVPKSADSDTPPLPLLPVPSACLPVPSACMGTSLAGMLDGMQGGILGGFYIQCTRGPGDPEQCSRQKFVQEGHIMRFILVCNLVKPCISSGC